MSRHVFLVLALMLWCATLGRAAGDDDDAPPAGGAGELPTLNPAQEGAAQLRIAHPLRATAPEHMDAMGVVLDATELLADQGESDVAAATEHATAAELARLGELYRRGAGASLRMLETAQAEQAKSDAQTRLAAARFAQRWGPLLTMTSVARQRLMHAAATGVALLMRADLAGQHSLGMLPTKALIDVDGILVAGRVLGALRASGELQSAGLLIAVDHPPVGLEPGARVPLVLLSSELAGYALPRDAVLYDADGAYVYKQLTAASANQARHYAPVKITLLQRYGEGWLATGVDADDAIVVQGAGLLWSLQALGARAADDDDD